MNRIKILFLIDTISGPHGGTEKHLLELVEHLDRNKFEVYLGCLYPSQWLKNNPLACPQIILDFKGYLHPNFLWQLLKLVKFLRYEKIQILQTFFLEANIIGILSALLAGVPYRLATRRNLGHRHTRLRTFILRIILRILKSATTLYLANCHKVKEFVMDLEKITPQKVQVIYNGIDPVLFQPALSRCETRTALPKDKLIVGMVANLKIIKGIDYFLKAASLIRAKRADVLFVIIGGEYREKYYFDLRDEMGLQEVVHFLGIKENVVDYLQAFDVAVNSSLTEGFSNSILEYMACGLPVVATEVGGNTEAVIDGETGILVPPRDAKKLAQAIEILLADEKLRLKMGEKGRQRILEQFTQSRMLREMEQLYSKLANVC